MKHFFVCIAFILGYVTPGIGQAGLNKFVFSASKTKVLPGKTPERGNDGKIKEADQIGRLGLVSLYYQNACYTSGRYNHNDFKVSQGKVRSGKLSFDAYQVFAPRRKAKKFLASQHCIAFKFPQKQSYTIYTLKAGKVDKVAKVKASQVNTARFTSIKTLKVSRLTGSVIYFFAPTSQRISSFKQLSANTEGSQTKTTPLGTVFKYRFKVNASVFHTGKDYGRNRQFFLLKSPKNRVQMIWQDKKNKRIYLSNFMAGFKSQQNVPLYNPQKADLLAATNDTQGNLYYFTYQGSKGNTRVALYKATISGKFLKTKQYDTSKKGLNIYNFRNYMVSLQHTQGKIALMIGRTMHKSGDGLHHQGGIAVVFDANTLSKIRNHGQTSGHSFDNYLTTNKAGKFVAMDLGDNYPRGVNLHRFDGTRKYSQVVYTFKTEHGTRATSPARRKYGYYAEISKGGKKYYKWSNDNGTYSELGGLVEVSNGYLIIFTGEPSPTGKALDNSRAGYKSPDPRNVGLVKVRKDFEKSSSRGSQISDDMVLSRGITESGGFYTFGGRFSKQRNAGVKWLTKYRDKNKTSARHLKVAPLSNGQVLLVWEVVSKQGYSTYQNTFAMKIDANGNKLGQPVALGRHVRLGRRDDLLVMGNKVFIPAGNGVESKIELIVINTR
ncbi:hypothetical protein [uncultured Microscilla sp.]|uniref:hypothetical protein n=1 Tax=uncultured Microscilla sp. TaxID=432653 RepID=UPI0026114423|nr:hypothetical protein [uncultured Microscilla sp.]